MKKTAILSLALTLFSAATYAQKCEFNKLKFTRIKGATKLSAPVQISAGGEFISVGKRGWASPAIFDWNSDGKLDLLIGEYGQHKDANLLIYENTGSNEEPIYSEPYYAKDLKGDKFFVMGY